MPKCLNDESKRYNGNENTPKGKGYTASAEKIGKRMLGLDGRMYVVTKAGKYKKWTLSDSAKKKILSPMAKKKKKTVTYEEEEEDLEWKLEAAEERCRLSDVFCTESLLMNVALLAWNYFKDWYQRVRHGEDPYRVYNDIKMVN